MMSSFLDMNETEEEIDNFLKLIKSRGFLLKFRPK